MNREVIIQTAILSAVPIVSLILGYYIHKWHKNNKIPTKWIQIGNVKQLNLYPLKSGRRIELENAECTNKGLRLISDVQPLSDRNFMIYGESDKQFRTARTYPKMEKIEVSVYDKDTVKFDAPNMESILVKIPIKGGTKVNIKYFDEQVEGIDCGNEVAKWVSEYILNGTSGLRVCFNSNVSRNIEKYYPHLIQFNKNLNNNSSGNFSDLAAIMIINEASVDDLNKKLDEPITANYFRPSIVVYGPKAYDEDKWDWIKIGDKVVLRFAKECTRCIMININPETAERNSKREPLKTLETYRKINKIEKSPTFGMYFSVKQIGHLQVGDPVYVPSL